jgi:hypothetical protein
MLLELFMQAPVPHVLKSDTYITSALLRSTAVNDVNAIY